jgi:histidinol dehydrogenase
MIISPIENHRQREKGALAYPVYSRRSNGLSIGINLFPDRKICSFDCPYCEVFPFILDAAFFIKDMEKELISVINEASDQGVFIQDICFSGNGEPTFSPYFQEALESAARVRRELAPSAALVVITNGAGLLKDHVFDLLQKYIALFNLDLWLKLDAGTESWFHEINRPKESFIELFTTVKRFTLTSPVTIQTMLCSVNGKPPPETDEKAWEDLIVELARTGNVKKVQLYGKARPSPDQSARELPREYLEKRAFSLGKKLENAGIQIPITMY